MLVSLFLVGCARLADVEDNPKPTQTQTTRAHTKYRLRHHPWGWSVEAQIRGLDAGTKVCAPAVGQRAGEALRWVEPADIHWDASGCFGALGGIWTARYEVEIQAASGRALAKLDPWTGDRGSLWIPGEALFLNVPGRELLLAEVAFLDDAGGSEGQVLSTWSTKNPHPKRVEIEGQRALLRSALWWVPAEQTLWRSDGGDVVWVGPDLGADTREIWKASWEDAKTLAGWFGAQWVPGREARGQLHIFVLEVAEGLEAAEGLARRGGVVLRVPKTWLGSDPEQTRQRRWLLAHEIFHRYNGESLYFSESASKAERAKGRAFTEGMTSYVAVLAMAQLGWLDAAETEALLMRLTIPVAGQEREGSAYSEGVAQSWTLDKALRQRSNGQRSVQGFWILLSRLPAYWERPLALSELDQWLTRYGGVGWGE